MIDYITSQRLETKEAMPDYVLNILLAITLSSKNIYNASLFIVKNVLSSYQYNRDINTYVLKDKRHDNEVKILKIVNEAIRTFNIKKHKDYDSALIEYNKEIVLNPKFKIPKDLSLKTYSKIISPETYWQIINKTLLETSLKIKEAKDNTFVDYGEIHSHIAQPSLQSVCNDLVNYKKALKAYYQNKESFTGKPKLPNYKPKDSKKTFSIPIDRFKKKSTSEKVEYKDNFIQILKSNKLYEDSNKTKPISRKDIELYNEYPLVKYELDFVNNKFKNSELLEIKIVPGKLSKKSKNRLCD